MDSLESLLSPLPPGLRGRLDRLRIEQGRKPRPEIPARVPVPEYPIREQDNPYNPPADKGRIDYSILQYSI